MGSKSPSPVIVALDVDTRSEALEWVRRLAPQADIFKIGLQLFSREGFSLAEAIIQQGCRVFVDLKLHDIPNTVAQAVRALARPGVEFLTLHASGGAEMMAAAAGALKEVRTENPAVTSRLLAVTVLTSLDDSDLREIGVDHSVQGQALNLARLARSAGMDGLVASPHEVRLLRRELGREPVIVTPGVRLAGGQKQDQKRVMTPREAMQEGSDFLVMGRSILESPQPEETLRQAAVEASVLTA